MSTLKSLGFLSKSLLFLKAASTFDVPTMQKPAAIDGSPQKILFGKLKTKIDHQKSLRVLLICLFFWSTHTFSQTTNVALSGTATQNSTAFAGDAVLAIDNNTDGFYNNGSTTQTAATTAYDYWHLDLGEAHTISEIIIYNRTDCCEDRLGGVRVMVSDTPFTLAATVTGLNNATTLSDFTYDFPSDTSTVNAQSIAVNDVNGRYVLIQKTDAIPSGDVLSLAEVQVMAAMDSDTDGVPDAADLDDDNDGILDTDECVTQLGGIVGQVPNIWYDINGGGELTGGTGSSNLLPGQLQNNTIPTYINSAATVSYGTDIEGNPINVSFGSGISVNPVATRWRINNATESSLADAVTNNDYLEIGFTTNPYGGTYDGNLEITTIDTYMQTVNGGGSIDSYDNFGVYISTDAAFATSTLLADISMIPQPLDGSATTPNGDPLDNGNFGGYIPYDANSFALQPSTTYYVRIYFYGEADGIGEFDSIGFDFAHNCDTDGDSIPDYQDLDSDNDGCYDALEGAGGYTYADIDGSGQLTAAVDADGIPGGSSQNDVSSTNASVQSAECDSCNSSSTLFTDNDLDGVGDVCDLDDDNDGILDDAECANSTSILINGSFEDTNGNTGASVPDSDVAGWESTDSLERIEVIPNAFIASAYNDNLSGAQDGTQCIELNAHENAAIYQDLVTTPGAIVSWSLYHVARKTANGSAPIEDAMIVEFGVPGGAMVIQATPTSSDSGWVFYSGVYSVPAGQTATRFQFRALASNGGNPAIGNLIDNITFSVCSDSDSDGIPNSLGLDSDNDGCPDALEGDGGFTYADIDANGQLTASVDANGIPSGSSQNDVSSANASIQSAECDPCNNSSTLFTDIDTDGVGDACDLDNDNDGILDSNEGYCLSNGWDATNNSFENSSITLTPSSTFSIPGRVGEVPNGNQLADFVPELPVGGARQVINANVVRTYTLNTPINSIYYGFIGVDFFSQTFTDQNGIPLTLTIVDVAAQTSVSSNVLQDIDPLTFASGDSAAGVILISGSNFTEINVTYSSIASGTDGHSISFALPCQSIDTDNDGIPDYLDLDSDNDGCYDALEGAGGYTYADVDGSGQLTAAVDANGIPGGSSQNDVSSTNAAVQSAECDSCNSSSTLFTDIDLDGVGDVCDLDNDNDGILDTVECTEDSGINGPLTPTSFDVSGGPGGPVTLNGILLNGTTYSDAIVPDNYSYDFSNSAPFSNNKVYRLENGTITAEFNSSPDWGVAILPAFQNTNMNDYQAIDTALDSGVEYWQVEYDSPILVTGRSVVVYSERGGNNSVILEAFDMSGTSFGVQISVSTANYVDTGVDIDRNGSGTENLEIATYQLDDLAPVGSQIGAIRIYDDHGGGDAADGKLILLGDSDNTGFTCSDTDLDTVPDNLDTDSDGDNCNDAVEAGFTDPDNDGVIGTSPVAVDSDGLVTGQGGYSSPADADGNTVYDFQEVGAAPSITTEPTDQKVLLGTNGSFDLASATADQYQWEVSTDGGSTFNAISDGAEYTDTQTNTLTLLTPGLDKNGHIYRAILQSSAFVCGQTISNEVTLTVGPKTIITNRRITVRVKKN